MIKLTHPESVGLSADRLNRISAHFNRYVDAGKLPGYLVLIARRGQAAYLHRYGLRDVDAGLPVEEDTIFRIYSMTKPITSVGLLMLYERGLLHLDDPASEYIPQFKQLEVFESGDAENYLTVPVEREMTIRDLLTHTSGLTYGHIRAHPIDAMYRQPQVFRRCGNDAGGFCRESKSAAVAVFARRPLELQRRHRCSRPRDRSHIRQVA